MANECGLADASPCPVAHDTSWLHIPIGLGLYSSLSLWPQLGLDKLCCYFNLLCFSVMLITCAYYAFKVNLLCSIMLQKLINNDGKYSQIYNCLYQ